MLWYIPGPIKYQFLGMGLRYHYCFFKILNKKRVVNNSLKLVSYTDETNTNTWERDQEGLFEKVEEELANKLQFIINSFPIINSLRINMKTY